MLSFLYIVLAFAIPHSFCLVHRGQHQKHAHLHHHYTQNDSTSIPGSSSSSDNGVASSVLPSPSSEGLGLTTSASKLNIAVPTPSVQATNTFSEQSIPFSSPIISVSSSPVAPIIASSAIATTNGSYWQPTLGSSWQIQLSDPVTNFSSPFSIIDLDLFDNPASTIKILHSSGSKLICYFSAGTFENWRPDASSFQSSDLGSAVDGWGSEWWVNTNSANIRNIMTARIELAASKGCDGVDPDNVDGYSNVNGLGLTQANAISYLEFLADAAHSRGLSIGLKNAGEIVGDILPSMEWEVNEQCIEYGECDLFTPFVEAGKPVFHVEYPSDAPAVSSQVKATSCAAPSGFSSVLKMMDLDSWIETC